MFLPSVHDLSISRSIFISRKKKLILWFFKTGGKSSLQKKSAPKQVCLEPPNFNKMLKLSYHIIWIATPTKSLYKNKTDNSLRRHISCAISSGRFLGTLLIARKWEWLATIGICKLIFIHISNMFYRLMNLMYALSTAIFF